MRLTELMLLTNIAKSSDEINDKIKFEQMELPSDTIYQLDTFMPIFLLYAKYYSTLLLDEDIFNSLDIVKNESCVFYMQIEENNLTSKNNFKDINFLKLSFLNLAIKNIVGYKNQKQKIYNDFTYNWRALISLESEGSRIEPKGIVQEMILKSINMNKKEQTTKSGLLNE